MQQSALDAVRGGGVLDGQAVMVARVSERGQLLVEPQARSAKGTHVLTGGLGGLALLTASQSEPPKAQKGAMSMRSGKATRVESFSNRPRDALYTLPPPHTASERKNERTNK